MKLVFDSFNYFLLMPSGKYLNLVPVVGYSLEFPSVPAFVDLINSLFGPFSVVVIVLGDAIVITCCPFVLDP